MTPKCPNCKRDQDDCVCVDEIESLRAQVAELKADNKWLRSAVTLLTTERDELKRQLASYKADADRLRDALNLWKVASDNAEESELDDMACYCIPMPLFCDACEATEAIDAALATTNGESYGK